MTEIRILSLTQPWASLVARGHKHWETRSWRTRYRGLIAIHAAKGLPAELRGFVDEQIALGRMPRDFPRGAIVAVAKLDVVMETEVIEKHLTPLERSLGNYEPGRFAWGLKGVVALTEPIPYRGALGLRRLEPEIVERINNLKAQTP